MKKLIALLIGIVLLGCKQELKTDYALFSGTVTNSDAKSLLVSGNGFKKEIEIKEGVFTDTLKIEEAGYYTFRIGRESSALHLEKGDNVNLSIDSKAFDESITYTGNGASKNNLLAQKYRIGETLTKDTKSFYSKDESEFLAIAKSVKEKTEAAINSADIPSLFKAQQLEDVKYNFASSINNYERYHSYFSKNEDFKASDAFKDNSIDVVYNNVEAYKSSDAYKNLVADHYNDAISEAYDETGDYGAAVVSAMKNVDNGYIKDELLKSFEFIALSPTESLRTTYDYFIANTTNDAYKNAFTEKYNKLKILAVGAPSPTFDYENHKGGKTALADLKGKYVYIDVWATWCGPCIAEIPALKKVEKKYHNKDIEFVSISIDTKKAYDKWKKMVVDKDLGGVQLLADNDWKSKFVTDYAIEGIPRFILIGPDGNIVNADAPRPSSSKLIEIFNELKI